MHLAFRQYGTVEELENGDAFLRVTDELSKESVVFVHIYSTDVKACRALNQCLNELSKEFPTAKFCRIVAQKLPTSVNFRIAALPCFQVYNLGQLVDNWVCLTEHIGLDFSVEQVKDFLQSHGYLLE